MKLFAKLMLAVLVLAMLLPFTILKDKSGKPLASFSDFSLPDFSMPDLSKLTAGDGGSSAPSGSLDGQVLIYKWYDASGDLQFTSEPPPDGIEYTVKGFDPNANVIQAVKLPAEGSEESESKPLKEAGKSGSLDNPYSKEAIEKLFEDAKNVEKLLQDRIKQQESALNQ